MSSVDIPTDLCNTYLPPLDPDFVNYGHCSTLVLVTN